MRTRGIRALPRLMLLAGLLTLTFSSACGDPPKAQDAASLGLPLVERPADATRGAPRAFLGAATGALTLTDTKATPLQAIAGAPLLADDKLILGADALAVLVFTNGNVLRLEGPLEQELRGLAGFNSKPVGDDLEAQLAAALSDRDRERLGAANERIGGWQLRLKALEAPAPESEAKPSLAPPTPDPQVPALRASGAAATPEFGGPGHGGYAGQGPAEPQLPSPELVELPDPKSKEEQNAGMVSSHDQGSTKDGRPPRVETRPLDDRPAAGEDLEPEPEPEPKHEHDEHGEPGETADKEDTTRAPLSLAGATWIDSQARVKVPAELRDELAACLRPIAGGHVIVEMTLRSGTITAIKLLKHSSGCAAELKGRRFEGVSGSGSVRLIFERD